MKRAICVVTLLVVYTLALGWRAESHVTRGAGTVRLPGLFGLVHVTCDHSRGHLLYAYPSDNGTVALAVVPNGCEQGIRD